MHQNKERRAKGRGALRALEVLNRLQDCNTSGYKLQIEETGKSLIDEIFFPRRTRQMIDEHSTNIDEHLTNMTEINVVSLGSVDIKWVNYDSCIDLNDFEKIHSGRPSDSCILRSTSDPDCIWESGKWTSSSHC